jgi:hypothetical protein
LFINIKKVVSFGVLQDLYYFCNPQENYSKNHEEIFVFVLPAGFSNVLFMAGPLGLTKVGYPGGKTYLYRLYLKDKRHSIYTLNHPEAYLSQRSLERRSVNIWQLTARIFRFLRTIWRLFVDVAWRLSGRVNGIIRF